ncbi:VOC family protein [Saccharomonospora xinjiangensis]|uniref:Lactoylglutathione lyase family protein n=1 Tax=Saccharomonospora xinjiangensis XJ-54 TaxID=882086 RepID=I0V8L4_9PSEU|nr:VOC family protein [Saccharomonospora xinjiangensis]EID56467.1 lactoylglutathione lyase family protein [Saccharomonospora xinjiangensis XJ-54]
MLRGLSTVVFQADDLDAAREWYTDVLGVPPYFAKPDEGPAAYIEFRLGDLAHELGIVARAYAPHPAAPHPSGAVVYWHVDDVQKTYDTLLAKGATEHEGPTWRSEDWLTASVTDPFGNILGLIHSPHYLNMLP